ncbi:hypothetical protein [Streptomyces liangshanensis]|uniref:hypothetical protein n=1 Tax=Streptomyces liangshanensis TaxID=2717324 RepID=UPI0036DF29D6
MNISLAVLKRNISGEAVRETLGLADEPSKFGAAVYSGPDWWAYTCVEESVGQLEAMVLHLSRLIEPRLGRVEALVHSGHSVEVAVAGTTETGDVLLLSPEALESLAVLKLPVSFTTLSVSGAPEEDPLAFLDE